MSSSQAMEVIPGQTSASAASYRVASFLNTAEGTMYPLTDKLWRYRGEGGANLVISVPCDKTVVRFAKSKYAGKDQVSPCSALKRAASHHFTILQDAKVGEIAYFANEIMRPLLGPTFVRPVRIGVVSDE
jgi:hypothetical protein